LKESPVMTATEVNAREFKMLEQFAPTLGRLQEDLLDPMVEGTYQILARAGELPEPPEGLTFTELDIEYIGPIPLAMKQAEANAIITYLGQTAGLAEVYPDLRLLPDQVKIGRRMGYTLGVDADLMHSDDEVEQAKAQIETERKEMMEFQKLEMASKSANQLGATQEEAPA